MELSKGYDLNSGCWVGDDSTAPPSGRLSPPKRGPTTILHHFKSSQPIKFAARRHRPCPCFTRQQGVRCSTNSLVLKDILLFNHILNFIYLLDESGWWRLEREQSRGEEFLSYHIELSRLAHLSAKEESSTLSFPGQKSGSSVSLHEYHFFHTTNTHRSC